MQKKYSLLLFGLIVIFSGCRKDDKLEKRLDGRWNIAKYENIKIFNDGHTEVLADVANAGYFVFYRDNDNLPVFDFSYTVNGSTQSGNMLYYKIDDHAKRMIIIGGVCIGCDVSYTIEENKAKKQVWSTYDLQQQGLSTDFVYKKKFELKKE